MINRAPNLSIVRPAELLGRSRSSVYYEPEPVSPADLALMRRIDELPLQWPFMGARMLRDQLGQQGMHVGRRQVATLMRKMGLEALDRKPNTRGKHAENPVFPYLLRGLSINRPNQVWSTDITYIPMARGFVYLVAVMDWATRQGTGLAAV